MEAVEVTAVAGEVCIFLVGLLWFDCMYLPHAFLGYGGRGGYDDRGSGGMYLVRSVRCFSYDVGISPGVVQAMAEVCDFYLFLFYLFFLLVSNTHWTPFRLWRRYVCLF